VRRESGEAAAQPTEGGAERSPRIFKMMLLARWLFMLIAILCVGCGPSQINAGFPEVPPPPVVKPDAPKIGVARVADSRTDRSGG